MSVTPVRMLCNSSSPTSQFLVSRLKDEALLGTVAIKFLLQVDTVMCKQLVDLLDACCITPNTPPTANTFLQVTYRLLMRVLSLHIIFYEPLSKPSAIVVCGAVNVNPFPCKGWT